MVEKTGKILKFSRNSGFATLQWKDRLDTEIERHRLPFLHKAESVFRGVPQWCRRSVWSRSTGTFCSTNDKTTSSAACIWQPRWKYHISNPGVLIRMCCRKLLQPSLFYKSAPLWFQDLAVSTHFAIHQQYEFPTAKLSRNQSPTYIAFEAMLVSSTVVMTTMMLPGKIRHVISTQHPPTTDDEAPEECNRRQLPLTAWLFVVAVVRVSGI